MLLTVRFLVSVEVNDHVSCCIQAILLAWFHASLMVSGFKFHLCHTGLMPVVAVCVVISSLDCLR